MFTSLACVAAVGCAQVEPSSTRHPASPLQALVGRHVRVNFHLAPQTSGITSIDGTLCEVTDGWLVLAMDAWATDPTSDGGHLVPTGVPNYWLTTAYVDSITPVPLRRPPATRP